MVARIVVTDLNKTFGEGDSSVSALQDVSFGVEDGSFVSIVGPSGCGKSTLLNILSGIETPTTGTVSIDSATEKPNGYVFQSPRLLPWRTVIDNMTFVHGSKDPDVLERCRSMLTAVSLMDVESKYPAQLSGGMQQRVGIARAFSIDPDVMFMDEPFSHLDAITAGDLRVHLSQLWKESGKTVMFVTHDVGEAVELSNRILLLETGGRIAGEMSIDLPYPRDPAMEAVALKKAELLGASQDLHRSR